MGPFGAPLSVLLWGLGLPCCILVVTKGALGGPQVTSIYNCCEFECNTSSWNLKNSPSSLPWTSVNFILSVLIWNKSISRKFDQLPSSEWKRTAAATDGTSAITLETDLAWQQHAQMVDIEQKDVLFSAQLLLVSFSPEKVFVFVA